MCGSMLDNVDVFRLFRETDFSNPAFMCHGTNGAIAKKQKIPLAGLQFEADSAALQVPVLPGANGCLCRCRTVIVFVVIY